MASEAIEAFRQQIAVWSEQLRLHLLQLQVSAASSPEAALNPAETRALVAGVVRQLEQMQRQVMVEIDLLNQRYQHEISAAPFWRRPLLQRRQTAEASSYREVILLIERVLLAASSITESVSTLSSVEAASPAETPLPSEPEPEPTPETGTQLQGVLDDFQDDESEPIHELSLLEDRLRELALHWKWRLDTTRTLLESPELSPERIAYIRGIQTTAWNILQDLSELLDDDSIAR